MRVSVQLEEGRERHVRFDQGGLKLLVYPHGIALEYQCKKACINWEEFTKWFTEPCSKPKCMCCSRLDSSDAELWSAEIGSIPLRDCTEPSPYPPSEVKAYVRFRIQDKDKAKRNLWISKQGVHYGHNRQGRTWCDLMQLIGGVKHSG